MLNVVSLQGNLTRDPETTVSKSGTVITKFSLAINRFVSGEKRVNYFDCVAFGKTAETVRDHCKKGKQVIVSGELTQDSWEDKDGNKRSRVVVTVSSFNGVHFVNDNKTSAAGSSNTPVSKVSAEPEPETNDDIPF